MPTHCRRQVQFQMSGCQILVRVVSDYVFVYYYHVFVFLYLPYKMLVQNQYKSFVCIFVKSIFPVVRRAELSDVVAILSRIRFPISDVLFWATTILIRFFFTCFWFNPESDTISNFRRRILRSVLGHQHTHQCFDTFIGVQSLWSPWMT